jgi:hypothetical protein
VKTWQLRRKVMTISDMTLWVRCANSITNVQINHYKLIQITKCDVIMAVNRWSTKLMYIYAFSLYLLFSINHLKCDPVCNNGMRSNSLEDSYNIVVKSNKNGSLNSSGFSINSRRTQVMNQFMSLMLPINSLEDS